MEAESGVREEREGIVAGRAGGGERRPRATLVSLPGN